jgi:hypothetical protein
MQGSLALARGTLFVGVHAKTARVRAFDLGGRELRTSFSFRDPLVGRSEVSGMAVDEDHALLIADRPADRVRRFSVFGREVGGIGAPAGGVGEAPAPALPGLIRRPVDVEVRGHRDEGWIAVASGGEARHAVQLFEPDFAFRASCRALGEPERPFRAVCRLAAAGELLFVAESLARRVQVFRSGQFLFAFHLTARDDGRMVVGCRAPHSALFLVDGAGRPLRTLALEGDEEGAVREPSDVVVETGADDRHTSVFVIDRDGLRVQAMTLEGRSLGSFSAALAGSTALPLPRSADREKEGGR